MVATNDLGESKYYYAFEVKSERYGDFEVDEDTFNSLMQVLVENTNIDLSGLSRIVH